MNATTLNKVLGFLLAGICAVSWWFIQQQVAYNTQLDQRVDSLESHCLMDEDRIRSLQKQLQVLRQKVEAK